MHQVAVILTDADRRIMWVNKDFEKITGYGLEEVLGKSPGKLLQGPDTDPEVVARIRRGLASQESFKVSITNYRKCGEAYACKLVIHPIFNHQNELSNYLAFEVDGNVVRNENRIPLMNLRNRYRTSSLRGSDETQIFQRVQAIMEQERLYLNPNLTLRLLADRLRTNTKYLSQVINNQGQTNFLGFVNQYRVQLIRDKLAQGAAEQRTFFGIAQQCGFRNKSTFYKVFQDFTGLTPRQYTKRMAEQRSSPV